MTVTMKVNPIIRDAAIALKLATAKSSSGLLQAWVYVPFGITLMLLACFGVDSLLLLTGVSFPASVACLVLLFLALLLCEALLGNHRTRRLVSIIDIPASWALRWMNVFFTPPFVLLPLSPSVGVIEVLKIVAVFVIGFFIMMTFAAYLTRTLQLLIGTSKRAQTQRAEDLDYSSSSSAQIPLTEAAAPSSAAGDDTTPPTSAAPSRPQTPPQLHLQQHHHRNSNLPVCLALSQLGQETSVPQQTPLPPPRAERWAAWLAANFDAVSYAVFLLLIGIPVYYTTGYAMPLHLTLNTVVFILANSLPPPSWRTYLHPVLTSSLVTVLLIWTFAASRGDSLHTALSAYRTGGKYLTLWNPSSSSSTPAPGAGDIFATSLDASILSLALPTFQHRRELKQHLTPLLVPSVLISVASLLTYPPLCRLAVGIDPRRSLAFASRSLTLALATPATENLGGDVNTAAALAIVSGILGVLCGQRILALLKIPEDDYVTRGVTLGINSSAIATALLLKTDPRAAALSCLSMVLFGTVTVVFTSIPPVADAIRSFVGL